MWLWEEDAEKADSNDDLVGDVRLLRSWFRGGDWSAPPLGYGRAWTSYSDKAFPLILFNSRLSPSPRDVAGGPAEPRPIEYLLQSEQRDALGLPKTSLPIFALFASPPEPTAGFQERLEALLPMRNGIYCAKTKKLGTAGVSVSMRDGSLGVLTAGHVLPCGARSRVESSSSWVPRLWPRSEPFGVVEHHSVPLNTIGWDVAVIRPDRPVSPLKRAITRFPSVRYGQELAYARGARSGLVDGVVLIAGLEEVRPAPLLGWLCCWLIAPASVLRKGDSGASVFVQGSGELLGTYVGGSSLGRSEPYALYVQDAHSLQVNMLSKWGVAF